VAEDGVSLALLVVGRGQIHQSLEQGQQALIGVNVVVPAIPSRNRGPGQGRATWSWRRAQSVLLDTPALESGRRPDAEASVHTSGSSEGVG
jgi:hypothetical protein